MVPCHITGRANAPIIGVSGTVVRGNIISGRARLTAAYLFPHTVNIRICRSLTHMTGMQEQVGHKVRAATGNNIFRTPQCQGGRFWAQLLSQLYSRVLYNWSGYNRIFTVPFMCLWAPHQRRFAVQSILKDGPPLRHELHLPVLEPQPALSASASTIVTRRSPPDAINAGRSLKWCSVPCATSECALIASLGTIVGELVQGPPGRIARVTRSEIGCMSVCVHRGVCVPPKFAQDSVV